MRQPRLTFACELDAPRLTELFADASVIAELQALRARVALMLSDYSPERAQVVEQLNQAGVPVVAIPLVSAEEGYYFTVDNLPQAQLSYERWKVWTAQHGLAWDGVGLDIEPEGNLYQQLIDNPWRLPAMLLPRWPTPSGHGAPSGPTPSCWSAFVGTAGRWRITSSR